ncbi:MAG: peptide deformylase [Rubrobacter sp.]|nr:peptide deformylase [Rubrobacter sp.]
MRTFGDPVLKSRAAPVRSFDGSLARLAEEMFETMREHEGVGLAANQVGRLKRIFVAEVEDRRLVVVNPVIEEASKETERAEEGCLSIPGVRVEVERPASVVLVGQDLEGAPLRIEAEGLLARVVQHETDHLDGILILDRVDRETRRAALRELRERMLNSR